MNLIGAIVSPEENSFVTALRDFRSLSLAEQAQTCLQFIRQSLDLSMMTRSRRLRVLMGSSPTLPAEIVALGIPDTAPPELRNEIAVASQAEFRPALFKTTTLDKAIDLPEPRALAQRRRQPVDAFRFDNVVIVSDRISEAQKSLILRKGLVPVHCKTSVELRAQLGVNKNICAFFVTGELSVPVKDFGEIIKSIARFSSFAWIRFPTDFPGKNGQQVVQLWRNHCGAEPASHRVSLQAGSDLTEADTDFMLQPRRVLEDYGGVEIRVGSLKASELTLFSSAAGLYYRPRGVSLHGDAPALAIREISTGRSGAKVLVVQHPSENGAIAKISSKDRALEEQMRFHLYLEGPSSPPGLLKPEAHFHGDDGIVLFPLIGDEFGSGMPAPTLLATMEDLWNDEVFQRDPEQLASRSAALKDAFSRLCETLAQLNSRRPPSIQVDLPLPAMPTPSIIQASPLKEIWQLPEDVYTVLDDASASYRTNGARALTHGDLHLENIILTKNHAVHIIDFASCGPGHPAVDLARLEMHLFLSCFRQTTFDREYIAFQRALTVDRQPIGALEHRFSAFFKLNINRICLAACVQARDRVADVLLRHSLSYADYVACKYLLCWQHLLHPASRTGLALATIEALSSAHPWS